MNIPSKDADFDTIRAWALQEPVSVKGCDSNTRDNLSERGLMAGYDWIQNNKPVSITKETRRTFKKHVKESLQNQPAGFILSSIILMAVIQCIVGWLTRKLLDEWFSQNK